MPAVFFFFPLSVHNTRPAASSRRFDSLPNLLSVAEIFSKYGYFFHTARVPAILCRNNREPGYQRALPPSPSTDRFSDSFCCPFLLPFYDEPVSPDREPCRRWESPHALCPGKDSDRYSLPVFPDNRKNPDFLFHQKSFHRASSPYLYPWEAPLLAEAVFLRSHPAGHRRHPATYSTPSTLWK